MNLIFLIPTYGNSKESRKVIEAMDCMKGEKSLGLHYHGVNPRGSHHDTS